MTDPFVDSHIAEAGAPQRANETMSRVSDPITSSSASNGATNGAMSGTPASPVPIVSADSLRANLAGRHVCPFCGTASATTSASQPCSRCTMEDTPVTRQATRSRIGPWYVLQNRNPAAPGMKFSTLLALVNKNQVTARSIVRGPTTHQLWRFAAHVRGLSREFGLCYSCGESLERTTSVCGHCERSQEPPANPDALIETRDAIVGANQTMIAAPRAASVPPPQTNNQIEPAPRQTNFPPVPSTAPRGDHAERLRMLNDGVAARTRPAIAGVRDPRKISGRDLASALQSDPASMQLERRFTAGRAVAVLLLLGLIGGGAYLFFNPDARETATVWSEEKWLWARDKVAAWQSQKKSADDSDSLSTEQADRGPDETPIKTLVKSPISPPRSLQSSVARGNEKSTAVTDVPAVTKTPALSKPEADHSKEPTPPAVAATSTVAEPPAGIDTATTTKPPANVDLADSVEGEAKIAKGRELWSKALAAEGEGNAEEALKDFEAIHKLPSFAWPTALEIRLESVKKQLGR